MPKFPVLSPQEIIKLLTKNGYEQVRQKGSHVILWNPKTKKHATVPISKKQLPIGTAKSILKIAGVKI